jgi:NhaA family Na+:H+ antiporter
MTVSPARRLVQRAVELSLVLPLGASVALVWANTAHASYERFAHALHFPVNDIGMVFFFALATKEVVEATAPGGALHTWRRAALPVVAATGGMVGPALIFVGIVQLQGRPELTRGWAIPCATDIAFSYLVAKAIFRQHPAIPFLLLLAIADDALGLVILALFYPTGDVRLGVALGVMTAACAASFALRRRHVTSFWPYVAVGGTLSWTALFWGGLHPALALVPVVPFMPRARRDPGLFVAARVAAHDTLSAFEHWWTYPVQGVLLLFGLVNAGVTFNRIGPGTWAVLIAILAGKPLGIGLSVVAARWSGLRLPAGLGWREVLVVGITAGIGFTVALFFATAAFPVGPLLDQTKMGALFSVGGSVVALSAAATLGVGRFRASRAARPG